MSTRFDLGSDVVEPDARTVMEAARSREDVIAATQLSIAISLKRIADALEASDLRTKLDHIAFDVNEIANKAHG